MKQQDDLTMIKTVGDTHIKVKHKATCHCGLVELEIKLANGIIDPRRCNCSMCRRKGTIAAAVVLSDIKIIKGEETLKLYQFNSHQAKHFFCSNCGIHTHHQRKLNPEQYGLNIACLEGVNPFIIDDVPISNGTKTI